MRLALIVIVVLAVVVVVAPYTFLPGFLESATADSLKSEIGLQEKPDVDLKSESPLGMLSGRFDSGRIEMDGLDIGDGVKADRVKIDLNPFDAKVVDSISKGTLQTEKPLSGTMEAELSERDILEIARSRVKDFPIRDVQLEKGRISVASEVEVLGFAAPVAVRGGLDLQGRDLIFTPASVEAFGVPLPGDLTDSLLGGTDFKYPLTGLPYDAKVTNLSVEKDRLIVSGKVKDIKLG